MSALRLFWFRIVNRLLGRRVVLGTGVRMRCWLELDGPGTVIIGNRCVIDTLPGAKREHVTLYTNDPNAVIRIGEDVSLYGVRMSCKYGITIEDRCLIEDAAIADTDFHSVDPSRADAAETPDECRVVIGRGASVGSWSVIGKGVEIGAGAHVMAGSVVRKSVPAGVTVMGNPARPRPA